MNPLNLPRNAIRDVDKLLPITDGKMAEQDRDYLAYYGMDNLFNQLMEDLVTLKPLDPVQYIIDSVEFNPEFAKQDPKTGLPEHRKSKLVDVFKVIDKTGTGQVSFAGLQQYTSKYGGNTLGEPELRSIFKDFQPQGDNLITLNEFLIFFAKVSRTIPNKDFMQLIRDLMA